MELWKDIAGFEGEYQVSNFGNVRSVDRIVAGRNNTTRMIKGSAIVPFEHWGGYLCIKLYHNNKSHNLKLHRLVLSAFNPTDNPNLDVNHIDGNKHNNRLDNLEWCTRKQNLIHAVDIGLNKQCIAIEAHKNGARYVSKSMRGMYRELKPVEDIGCKEKTFCENVRRALITNGTYYGYSFSRVVIS